MIKMQRLFRILLSEVTKKGNKKGLEIEYKDNTKKDTLLSYFKRQRSNKLFDRK